MIIDDFVKITTELDKNGIFNIPVYASEINTLEMHKVCGAKFVKSYADNGESVIWFEIQYAKTKGAEE